MIIEEQDYIEHFGVKGMRWGVRKETLDSTPKPRLSTGQKVGVGVAAYVSMTAGANFVAAQLLKRGKDPATAGGIAGLAGLGVAVAGGVATAKIIKRVGQVKAARLKEAEAQGRTLSNDEAIRRAQAFLDENPDY